jgi:hypothetical protein
MVGARGNPSLSADELVAEESGDHEDEDRGGSEVGGREVQGRRFSSWLWDRGASAHRPGTSSLFLHRGSQ